MTQRIGAAFFLVAILFMSIVASGEEFQNPPDAVMDLDPSKGILSGVPVELSATDSKELFDFEHSIEWHDNGVLISTEQTFVHTFSEGDHNVSLYVETNYGNDLVYKRFHVYENDVPEIEGQVIYYDPYKESEIDSNKQISVPQQASVTVEAWTEESDDVISYSVKITPCCGIEVAEMDEDDDELTVSLFASEPGNYEVLITATDEAGQTDTLEFRVSVGSPKDLQLDFPDRIDEGESIGFIIQHPCSDEICDYSLVVENQETGERQEYCNDCYVSFSDSGPMEITGSVSYNGSVLDTATKSFYVEDTKNDPPVITIEWVEPVYAQIPHTFYVKAWDDRGRVKEILITICGDYEDDERIISTKIAGNDGNITLTPRRADSYYEVVAKSCDTEGECTETSVGFDTLSPDEAPEYEEDDGQTESDWEEGSTEDTGFLSAVTTLFIITGVVLLMRKQR